MSATDLSPPEANLLVNVGPSQIERCDNEALELTPKQTTLELREQLCSLNLSISKDHSLMDLPFNWEEETKAQDNHGERLMARIKALSHEHLCCLLYHMIQRPETDLDDKYLVEMGLTDNNDYEEAYRQVLEEASMERLHEMFKNLKAQSENTHNPMESP